MKIDGPTLRRLREHSGWKLRTFADTVGISPAYLSQLERSTQANPSPPVVIKLASVLGVTVSTLEVSCLST